MACSVVNTSTEETACNVTKSVVCNAIQAKSWMNDYTHTDYTEAEKEACTYAPHACTTIAQNM